MGSAGATLSTANLWSNSGPPLISSPKDLENKAINLNFWNPSALTPRTTSLIWFPYKTDCRGAGLWLWHKTGGIKYQLLKKRGKGPAKFNKTIISFSL
jgi:hypothetical protein